MPGKKPTQKEVELASAGRAKLAERRAALAEVPVNLQVQNVDHAKSPEVLNYCRDFLQNGGRYENLRRELGLGPAYLDKRWRVIRQLLPEVIAPISEQDALLRMSANQLYMMNELEGILEDADKQFRSGDELLAQLNALMDQPFPSTKEEQEVYKTKLKALSAVVDNQTANAPKYLKVKLDALGRKFDENSREFQSYMDIKRLKAKEKGTQGTSIMVQYNYNVSRPGDNPAEKDVTQVERIPTHDK